MLSGDSGRLLTILGLISIGIEAEIVQHHGQHVVRVNRALDDAAILELRSRSSGLKITPQSRIDRCVNGISHDLAFRLSAVAPVVLYHAVDRILVARGRKPATTAPIPRAICVDKVRKLRIVELLEHAGLDLAGKAFGVEELTS